MDAEKTKIVRLQTQCFELANEAIMWRNRAMFSAVFALAIAIYAVLK